jgi:predicted DNA-binding protein
MNHDKRLELRISKKLKNKINDHAKRTKRNVSDSVRIIIENFLEVTYG